ncbi:carbohydrate porin [Bacillus amyloliquefaciens]|nr:carbohydrate porin [Bacillus amyloliquefaciens]
MWISFNIYFDTYSSLIERDVYNLYCDGNDSDDRYGVQLRFKYYLC